MATARGSRSSPRGFSVSRARVEGDQQRFLHRAEIHLHGKDCPASGRCAGPRLGYCDMPV